MNGRFSKMNQIKKDLEKELQSVTLSDEKKHLIVKRAKASARKNTQGSIWSYRFVLAVFPLFMIGFVLLVLQQGGNVKEASNAAEFSEDLSNSNLFFASDWMKGIILIGVFIGIRLLAGKLLERKGKGLPACIECGEEWSTREARKMGMKNGVVSCPNCGKKQYKTRKSAQIVSTLNFLLPLGILISQLFSHILLGYLIHAAGSAWLIFMLTPFIIELQEEDPIIKPLY